MYNDVLVLTIFLFPMQALHAVLSFGCANHYAKWLPCAGWTLRLFVSSQMLRIPRAWTSDLFSLMMHSKRTPTTTCGRRISKDYVQVPIPNVADHYNKEKSRVDKFNEHRKCCDLPFRFHRWWTRKPLSSAFFLSLIMLSFRCVLQLCVEHGRN
jgi:hypothetical protein